jgi:hypothetical protein
MPCRCTGPALEVSATAGRTRRIVDAPTRWPSVSSSPWIRWYPVGLGNAMQCPDLQSSCGAWAWMIVGCCCCRSCTGSCAVYLA